MASKARPGTHIDAWVPGSTLALLTSGPDASQAGGQPLEQRVDPFRSGQPEFGKSHGGGPAARRAFFPFRGFLQTLFDIFYHCALY